MAVNTKIQDDIIIPQENFALRVGSYSIENKRGRDWATGQRIAAYPNQDRFIFNTNGTQTVLGVCDGHGTHGDELADFVSVDLPEFLQKHTENIPKQIRLAINHIVHKLHEVFPKKSIQSGTTAVFGVIHPRTDEYPYDLTVGNVGDSRFVLGKKTKISQTRDHKPTDPIEAELLKKQNAIIEQGRLTRPHVQGSLALSRSLGDFCVQPLTKPNVYGFTLEPGDIVIFASDGLWDVMESAQTIFEAKRIIVKHQNNPKTATLVAQFLAATARAQKSRDDISVQVMIIE